MTAIHDQIDALVKDNSIVLFMKGTPDFPQCGFSAKVAHILRECGANNYVAINVLDDPDMRQGIKDYAQWPTIPQLYIKGEFIGGCDIVTDLFESGELEEMLNR